MGYLYLAFAIAAEVAATSALKATDGFTKIGPLLVVIFGYTISFYLLSLVLRTIPVGIAYAIWSSVGIVAITFIAAIVYKQIPDIPSLIGIALIIVGVLTIYLFSSHAE